MALLSSALEQAAQRIDGRILLCAARAAIGRNFGWTLASPIAPWLDQPGATFVTLKAKGEVRGCVGTLKAHRRLLEDVEANSIAAAFRDPRFSPLTQWEFLRVRIEVSLLSALRLLAFADEGDAISQLEPYVHGVALEYGSAQATFLPQVWEELPDPAMFLAQLKRKAGLTEWFWSPELKLRIYTVAKWGEGTEVDFKRE
jgi:AmmeMemoRadiSam system protein A